MLFVSRRRNLRVVLSPTDRTVDSKGRSLVIRGVTCEFAGGRFTTTNEEVIKSLLEHPLYGLEFTSDIANETRWKAEHQDIKVITGARSTLKNIMATQPEIITPVTEITEVAEVAESLDIEALIDKKMDEKMKSFLEDIKMALALPIPTKEPTEKPKQRLVCVCGAEFKTGFDLGKHKKGCWKLKKVQPSKATPSLQPTREV